eukprot:17434-Heterococcus_DN1.PRE.2
MSAFAEPLLHTRCAGDVGAAVITGVGTGVGASVSCAAECCHNPSSAAKSRQILGTHILLCRASRVVLKSV